MISGVEPVLSKVQALQDYIRIWFRIAALCCGLGVVALVFSVEARASDALAGYVKLTFLSNPEDKAEKPDDEPPREMPQAGSRDFDGNWIFTGAGCPNPGSVLAKIIGGKIFVRGGGGRVDPDGSLHSVGAGNGITLTAVGQLSGNTGSGTFTQSDGCVGHWIAVKRSTLRGRRP
jgi:hypothetical protein